MTVTCDRCDFDYDTTECEECPQCGDTYVRINCEKHKRWWSTVRYSNCPECEEEQS